MGRVTTSIQIDSSAHCQLACPSCPTASGATRAAMGAGHLDPARFAALLDNSPQLLDVELSNYGEMFLNPRLVEIFRIAHQRKVVLHADNGVNLNHAPEDTLEALVRHRFRSMSVSIDGTSSETYARYRVRGDFDRVIGNIRKINEFKSKLSTVFPLLTWQFIVFGHNEHEIPAAKRMAAELGMIFRPKISWDDDVTPVRNPEFVRIQTGLAPTRDEHYRATGASYGRTICHQLWSAPVLNWDGRVIGCCRNFWGDFGANAFETGLAASLESPKLRRAQEMLTGRAPAEPGIPCTTCELYLTMQRDGNWITEKELPKPGGPPPVLVGVTIEPGKSEATHVDVFALPGAPDRRALVNPPPAQRLRIGEVQRLAWLLPAGGDFTVYALPKRLDPAFRVHYPPMTPVFVPFAVGGRPIVQEIRIRLDGDQS